MAKPKGNIKLLFKIIFKSRWGEGKTKSLFQYLRGNMKGNTDGKHQLPCHLLKGSWPNLAKLRFILEGH